MAETYAKDRLAGLQNPYFTLSVYFSGDTQPDLAMDFSLNPHILIKVTRRSMVIFQAREVEVRNWMAIHATVLP